MPVARRHVAPICRCLQNDAFLTGHRASPQQWVITRDLLRSGLIPTDILQVLVKSLWDLFRQYGMQSSPLFQT